eukprot:5317625-Alexandrium_andersonii.AAC.2
MPVPADPLRPRKWEPRHRTRMWAGARVRPPGLGGHYGTTTEGLQRLRLVETAQSRLRLPKAA